MPGRLNKENTEQKMQQYATCCDLLRILMPGKPGSVNINDLKLKSLASRSAVLSSNGNVYVGKRLYMTMENGCFVPVQSGKKCTTPIMASAVVGSSCVIFQTSTGSNYIVNLQHDGMGLFEFTDTVKNQIDTRICVSKSVFSPAPPSDKHTCAEFFLCPELFLEPHDSLWGLYS